MSDGSGLVVRGLTIRYGGATAVDGVDLDVPRGRVTGLIGPNGAGKSSTFGAITGLITPSSGSVLLDGRDLAGVAPWKRAQLGLGRTFQRVQLADALDVAQNVAMGREALLAGTNPFRHLRSGAAGARTVRQACQEALELCGIIHLADVLVGQLSTGQRRLVELARAVATGSSLLLLDEPSSGLDRGETENFAEILRTLVYQRGAGVLLVEHDIELVMSLCEELFVIDFGKPIFTGTPEEARSSDKVRAAYLGEAA
jgi:ABC-type branched-subunit amino acid transport system ATPase component